MVLGRGTPDEGITPTLHFLTLEKAFAPSKVVDRISARLCLAGIWLLYDHLEECHRIAQELDTKDAAYWHAIMHRREGDFSNSKYWWRRVGNHATFPHLCGEAKKLTEKSKASEVTAFLLKQSRWDPFSFVDLCEACVKGRATAENLCRQIQQKEWRLLFDYCHQKAIGGVPFSSY